MDKDLQSLRTQESEIRKKIYSIQEKRELELITKHRKDFVGKCFKYRNSSGSHKAKWWLYLKILDVSSINFHNEEEPVFKVLKFEIPDKSYLTINIDEHQYVREGQWIPISSREFNTAKVRLLKTVSEYFD